MFIKKIIFSTFFAFSFVLIFNYFEDPMHFYKYDPKKRLFKDPVLMRFMERWQGYGLVKNYPHDLLVIGSSVSRFPVKDVEKTYHLKSLRASMSGGSIQEASIVANQSQAQYIVWIIDQEGLTEEILEDFPLKWYQKKWNRHFSYLAQSDIFFGSIRNVLDRMMGKMQPAQLETFSTGPAYSYGKKYVLAAYQAYMKETKPLHNAKEKIKIFQKHSMQTIKKYPYRKFDIILPAASIYSYFAFYKQGLFEDYLKIRSTIINELLNFKNVRIFDFESHSDLILDLNEYGDLRHHSIAHYQKMLSLIAQGKNLVTKENVNFLNEKFKTTVLAFAKQNQNTEIKKDLPKMHFGMYR
jgi:hypothetical protein